MSNAELKKKLRFELLKPKRKLREERLKSEFTTSYVASLIGLERRQYEKKEAGEFPFHDYEMKILADKFGKTVTELFY